MFLLQQGWGMLDYIADFLQEQPNSGIIFSPRICEREQLERYLPKFTKIKNSEFFFDPFFYEPRTDLHRVLSYPFFDNYDFKTNTFDINKFCELVVGYQVNELRLKNVILPGRYTNSLSEKWLSMHYDFAQFGKNTNGYEIFSTIALGPDVILNSQQFNSLIDEIVNYPVDGIYFVYEHPANNFLIDEDFLYVLLDGLLSISRSGKKVVIGYSNQQSLILAAAGIDFIASGNFRNVRSFDHLNTKDRDEIKRKAIWYFDGNTFGEYKKPALNLAFRRNLRNHFGPKTKFSEELLSSEQPADIQWPEKFAFCHYLHLMHSYVNDVFSYEKKDRGKFLLDFFQKVKENNLSLSIAGFNFGDRGFNNHIDSSIAALELFLKDRIEDINNL